MRNSATCSSVIGISAGMPMSAATCPAMATCPPRAASSAATRSSRSGSVPAAMALHHLFDVLEHQLPREGHLLVRGESVDVQRRDGEQDVKIAARDGGVLQPGALISETPHFGFRVGDGA